jgi:5-deoxy-glucuronate isomerase
VTKSGLPATSPGNRLTPEQILLRPDAAGSVSVDPARAGWRYLSFLAQRLDAGGPLTLDVADHETAIVLLRGGPLRVTSGASTWELPDRPSPFEALPSAVYLPTGVRGHAEVPAGAAAEVAIARAPSSGRAVGARVPVVIRPSDVGVEVRGAGNATRQVNHVIPPSFPADRLLVVEVLTPSGNWSSWPPHKHDVDAMPGEAVLEEVYHYRFARPEAWGIQRVYRRAGTPAYEASGPRDAVHAVGDGDVVIVTDGYHPFVATHGDDAYYLNALAGDRRTMACSFDPDLDRVLDEWLSMAPDPRLPLVAG